MRSGHGIGPLLIDGKDIIKIHSDNFFCVSDLKKMMQLFKSTKTSTVTTYPWRKDRHSNTTGITIFSHKDLDMLYMSSKRFYPRLLTFLGVMDLNALKVGIVELSKYINMNEFFDYKNAVSFVERKEYLK